MNSEQLKAALTPLVKGDVDISAATLDTFSHDASLFEVRPQVVVFPKSSADVQAVMKWVSANKKAYPALSITARSAGTDMSGGAVNDSIILNFTKYMNAIKSITPELGIVEPGCFFRDFDRETQKIQREFPSYPASREICAVGGIISNNSGGEKTIKYGKTENYIAWAKVVFTDGNEYLVKPLSRAELDKKCEQKDFEGGVYRNLRDLIFNNKDEIMAAKPKVSKNSAGYYLWNVWNEVDAQPYPASPIMPGNTFDLCRLICGSQGTLGIVTEFAFRLVPVAPYSGVLAIFLPGIDQVPALVNEIMPYGPDSLETYDDNSAKLAIKFFFDFFKELGFAGAVKLGVQFIPEGLLLLTGGIPKLTIIVQFTGSDQAEIYQRLLKVQAQIKHFGFKTSIAKDAEASQKYWEIRRQSFNLLRKHVHGKRTAPFVDDIIVRPENLPKFLPELNAILAKYPELIYTVAGHAGDGNFHIIPLMDLKATYSADEILEISHQVYKLVISYHGSITAEHNDGIIRTPFLAEMYGDRIVGFFKQTKEIFDPQYILNPGKKVGGTFDDIKKKLIKTNN